MSKATNAATVLGGGFVFWLVVLLNWVPLPISETFLTKVWPTLPFVALVGFASYSLVNIGYSLITFRDCPEAHEELMKEIDVAITDLRSKNVTVD
ncbi:dolichol-phosphate mannosyltransferase subunit 3 [Neoconidiobolus thromboides FSU 785]|nr:dolichol-phosphate mannosyltransferase subunit 3 [Neoconidiobolus thromboides FSU 785]